MLKTRFFFSLKFRLYAFEYCDASLDKVFLKKYTGPVPSKFQTIVQLAKGLKYIHSKNLVHRDIKPQNVLISATPPATVKWADFGMSKPVHPSGFFSNSDIKGTSTYIAPELLNRNSSVIASTKSDIFSFGCLCFEIMTEGEHHPFGSRPKLSTTLIEYNILSNRPVNLES